MTEKCICCKARRKHYQGEFCFYCYEFVGKRVSKAFDMGVRAGVDLDKDKDD